MVCKWFSERVFRIPLLPQKEFAPHLPMFFYFQTFPKVTGHQYKNINLKRIRVVCYNLELLVLPGKPDTLL